MRHPRLRQYGTTKQRSVQTGLYNKLARYKMKFIVLEQLYSLHAIRCALTQSTPRWYTLYIPMDTA